MSTPELSLPPETTDALRKNHFDPLSFERLRARLQAGEAAANNAVSGAIEPIDVSALASLDDIDEETKEHGEQLLRSGKVGCIILAGGMATRFGGVVKAAVEVDGGKDFLTLKVEQVRTLAERLGAQIPVFLMTSFATHDVIVDLANKLQSDAVPITCFKQFISIRLTEEGEIFFGDDGEPSLYAPGHGDLTFALRRDGLLSSFRENGGEHFFMSNVDNLAASLDPRLVGLHARSGADITVEVVSKDAGDKGGAPAKVDGKPQVVEAFRFPRNFDQDTIPVFNTNTFFIRAGAVDRPFELDWFVVRKEVDGHKAVQFERLVGQLTAFVGTRFVHVPRRGEQSRFLPVKDPDELSERLEQIRKVAQRG